MWRSFLALTFFWATAEARKREKWNDLVRLSLFLPRTIDIRCLKKKNASFIAIRSNQSSCRSAIEKRNIFIFQIPPSEMNGTDTGGVSLRSSSTNGRAGSAIILYSYLKKWCVSIPGERLPKYPLGKSIDWSMSQLIGDSRVVLHHWLIHRKEKRGDNSFSICSSNWKEASVVSHRDALQDWLVHAYIEWVQLSTVLLHYHCYEKLARTPTGQ